MEVEDTLVDDCDNNRTLVMKTPGDRKITVGFVVQVYNDKGKCIEQEFVAGEATGFRIVELKSNE